MIPTVGRIVHVRIDHGVASKPDVWVHAAIVTAVNDDTTIVNLEVFGLPIGHQFRFVAGVRQGSDVGQWFWPPRV